MPRRICSCALSSRGRRRQLLIVTRQGDGEPFADDATGMPETDRSGARPARRRGALAIIEGATEDDPLPRHDVEEFARRSGGNPLFLFQLLDAFRETGTLESLPGSIESLIAGEIDRLAPGDRTILRYAAVLGTSFDPTR